jgi:hypothetical protein
MAPPTDLRDRFLRFSESARRRSPLYGRLAAAAADDTAVMSLLDPTPLDEQRQPVLLLAAVHHLLLGGFEDAAVRRFYPTLSPNADPGDAWPAFRAFALDHAETIRALTATRSTQTNEIGRCTHLVPALGLVSDECGPLAQVDVGCSAGLNLLWPHYRLNYRPGGQVGLDSRVRLECEVRGLLPIPTLAAMPPQSWAAGLDASPIDARNLDEASWLAACVWPDQLDRFERLQAALAVAQAHPPALRRGDAVADVAALTATAAEHGHPVLTTSWALSYLSDDERRQFVAELDHFGGHDDLSWVIAESPAQTSGLPVPATDPATDTTVVSVVRWRGGRRTGQRLATAHPHGAWVRWEAP